MIYLWQSDCRCNVPVVKNPRKWCLLESNSLIILNLQVVNTVKARKMFQILHSDRNAYSPSADKWKLDTSRKPITAFVWYLMRKLEVRGKQG
jgi:hypothetical protein